MKTLRNAKRSIGVSCNDKKQFLTTSISSSVIKQKEIEQQKKLEKKRMAASQSEFLFKLSHTKEMHDNAKQNFVKNKGLFHNKTMTNLFLKNKKKEKPPPIRNFFVKVVTNFYNVLTIFEVRNRIYKYSINIGFLSLFSSSFLSIKDSFLFSFFSSHAEQEKR